MAVTNHPSRTKAAHERRAARTTVTLSRRQIGDADRVGGIELLILWPEGLGPEPALDLDHEREATAAERACAEQMVRESCVANDLVPAHVRVARVQRPYAPNHVPVLPAGGETRTHLAVTIIGRRWVHASTRSRGRTAFAQ